MSFDFAGARALATGGTRGLGAAIALALVEAGADVTVTGAKAAAPDYDADLSRYRYLPMNLNAPYRLTQRLADKLAARGERPGGWRRGCSQRCVRGLRDASPRFPNAPRPLLMPCAHRRKHEQGRM